MKNLKFLQVIKLLFGIVLILNISFPVYGQKKFYKAIRKGNVDAVSSYISSGGNLNEGYEDNIYDSYYGEKNSYDFTPMEYFSFELVAELMEHGANLQVSSHLFISGSRKTNLIISYKLKVKNQRLGIDG